MPTDAAVKDILTEAGGDGNCFYYSLYVSAAHAGKVMFEDMCAAFGFKPIKTNDTPAKTVPEGIAGGDDRKKFSDHARTVVAPKCASGFSGMFCQLVKLKVAEDVETLDEKLKAQPGQIQDAWTEWSSKTDKTGADLSISDKRHGFVNRCIATAATDLLWVGQTEQAVVAQLLRHSKNPIILDVITDAQDDKVLDEKKQKFTTTPKDKRRTLYVYNFRNTHYNALNFELVDKIKEEKKGGKGGGGRRPTRPVRRASSLPPGTRLKGRDGVLYRVSRSLAWVPVTPAALRGLRCKPLESAAAFGEGTERRGVDGRPYVVMNGRWRRRHA